jgi:hypothetical protein
VNDAAMLCTIGFLDTVQSVAVTVGTVKYSNRHNECRHDSNETYPAHYLYWIVVVTCEMAYGEKANDKRNQQHRNYKLNSCHSFFPYSISNFSRLRCKADLLTNSSHFPYM